jgi:beta-glucosidase
MSYRNAALPISERIDDLLAQMTLDEKLAQLISFWVHELIDGQGNPSQEQVNTLLKEGVGQITRPAGASTLGPAACARTINALQRFLVNETRLGIPAIMHEECCSGYTALGGTTFPQMIGVASSFQPDLAEQMASVIRQQMRAVGTHQGLAPVLDVARDPRWGRTEETFGEDPTLISQFGMAYIKGLQGKSLTEGGVMATGKHFVGHSYSQGGQNCAPVRMGVHDLWDIALMPFQAAIRDAGLHTIMNSYPELDGVVVAASRHFLTGLLREQLGFDGLLTSDYEAIPMIHNYHNMAANLKEAAILALQAGIDVELPSRKAYGDPLKAALEERRISLEMVDLAVRRHLQKKFELGLFEKPFVDEGHVLEVFETLEQRTLARKVAWQSMVLLTNNGMLPLKKNISKLAVIGPNAADTRNLVGDYSYTAMLEFSASVAAPGSNLHNHDQPAFKAQTVKMISVLEAIRAIIPTGQVVHAKGCEVLGDDRSGFDEALRVASQAEAVVLVLGDRSGLTATCSMGETRDSADLRLPGVQEELADAILATGKPVTVVLITGRPYAINSIAEKADAILEAWLPGEEGGAAVAETLFGDNNPGGKLAMTFPRHAGQLPIFYSQKPSGGKSNWYGDYVTIPASPLFPFGHGLSYTSFEYSAFAVSRTQASSGESVDVSVSLKNSGPRTGDEVVQLYICDMYGSIPRPVKELKGFIRLELEPSESRRVTFHLPVDQLAFYDEKLDLVVEAGTIKIMVGSSSDDIRCEGSFEITGAACQPVKDRVFICPVTVE